MIYKVKYSVYYEATEDHDDGYASLRIVLNRWFFGKKGSIKDKVETSGRLFARKESLKYENAEPYLVEVKILEVRNLFGKKIEV